jgi:hypothetical protein
MDRSQVLLHMYEDQCNQLAFRRSRENEIFTWTASLLLAFVGGVLLVSSDNRAAFLQTVSGVILASVTLLLVMMFSVIWQSKQRKHVAEHQKTLVLIQQEIGCFSGDKAKFPDDWQNWGKRHVALRERLWHPSKIAATVLIGMIAIAAAILAGNLPLKVDQGSAGHKASSNAAMHGTSEPTQPSGHAD